MNYIELQKRITENEKQQKFDEHITEINYENAIKVDGNFDYYVKSKSKRFKQFFQRNFIVKPYRFYKNTFVNKVRVFGKENLKNVDSAIVTCNHTNKFDCFAVQKALKNKKVKIVAGDFNNQKGFFGEMMRVGGMMPLGSDLAGMRNFNEALSYFLKQNYLIVFYPEQAMWTGYEKPRPLKNGAFHYAVKNNVSILPLFITYRHTNKRTKDSMPIKYMDIHILPLIKSDLQDKQKRMNELMEQNSKVWEECYKTFKNS